MKVRKYTEMIIPELNPSMVVLFGSYAKGTEIRGIWVRVSNLFLRVAWSMKRRILKIIIAVVTLLAFLLTYLAVLGTSFLAWR